MVRKRKGNAAWKIALGVTLCITLVMVLVVIAVGEYESRTSIKIEDAGQQLTAHTDAATTAQVFMNGRWHAKRDVDTVLLIGIDNMGLNQSSGSYTNLNQADFLALFIHDKVSGKNSVIHLNRDTMTDIPVLGVTGEAAGKRHAQLALAYNYGQGGIDSGRNTAKAVSHLLYGAEVDHFITLAMDAVPIVNDWAGGVTVKVEDDFTGIDDALQPGSEVTLLGQQALTYVRVRRGLDDSTNLQRMKRQRTYASQWLKAAQPYLNDTSAVAELILQLSDYHYSDCTANELSEFAAMVGQHPSIEIYEIDGEARQGEQYMEFYVDESAVQQLVLKLFYSPV